MLERSASLLGSDIEVFRSSFLAAVVSASSLNGWTVSDLVDAGLEPGGSEAIARKVLASD